MLERTKEELDDVPLEEITSKETTSRPKRKRADRVSPETTFRQKRRRIDGDSEEIDEISVASEESSEEEDEEEELKVEMKRVVAPETPAVMKDELQEEGNTHFLNLHFFIFCPSRRRFDHFQESGDATTKSVGSDSLDGATIFTITNGDTRERPSLAARTAWRNSIETASTNLCIISTATKNSDVFHALMLYLRRRKARRNTHVARGRASTETADIYIRNGVYSFSTFSTDTPDFRNFCAPIAGFEVRSFVISFVMSMLTTVWIFVKRAATYKTPLRTSSSVPATK